MIRAATARAAATHDGARAEPVSVPGADAAAALLPKGPASPPRPSRSARPPFPVAGPGDPRTVRRCRRGHPPAWDDLAAGLGRTMPSGHAAWPIHDDGTREETAVRLDRWALSDHPLRRADAGILEGLWAPGHAEFNRCSGTYAFGQSTIHSEPWGELISIRSSGHAGLGQRRWGTPDTQKPSERQGSSPEPTGTARQQRSSHVCPGQWKESLKNLSAICFFIRFGSRVSYHQMFSELPLLVHANPSDHSRQRCHQKR